MMKKETTLDPEAERIATLIVDAAYQVHSRLGAGLLESVYEVCLAHELTKRNIAVQRQVPVSIRYDQIFFDEGFRIDLMVEDRILCEIKAVTEMHPVYQAQLMTYLKLTKKRLGFLINFNVPLIKNGINRVVL